MSKGFISAAADTGMLAEGKFNSLPIIIGTRYKGFQKWKPFLFLSYG
ncbi:hypothetical protein JYB62_04680 [Algoriphagus lutimaris]|nr:hypothetical protein [Algoriphagus lutimaris]MBN3519288.1 hypothetical protein [Algoriphagus lutimaris]